jgi:hypothetical protein
MSQQTLARCERTPHVRFGSKADIAVRLRDLRFAPKSGH